MKIRNFILTLILAGFVSVPSVLLGYRLAVTSGWLPEPVSVSGTGSMYPTFPKGEGTESAALSRQIVAQPAMKRYPGGILLFGNRYFSNRVTHNDIVSFENDKTRAAALADTGREAGYVKRVIAVSGDQLEIRDGFVWLNGSRLVENYTAAARSTYGSSFISDCQKLVIPEGFVFVMGDNRKASDDSRGDLGLVALTDIDHVLLMSDQGIYQKLWRDASRDYLQAGQSLLDVEQYLNLLNSKRTEHHLQPLTHRSKLDVSASIRAETMLTYNDLSFTATRSGLTMEKAMTRAGYSNIVWGEAPTLGYYSAEELIENYFYFSQSRDFLLNPDFQDTGISALVGEINGCPVQIVVQHLAGYKPPDYQPAVIKSWDEALIRLKEVLPGWEKSREYGWFYDANRQDIEQVIGLIETRILRLEAIVSRMKQNEWLSPQEKLWYEEDESLAKQLEELTNKLNKL